jgi:hypothetical protein
MGVPAASELLSVIVVASVEWVFSGSAEIGYKFCSEGSNGCGLLQYK